MKPEVNEWLARQRFRLGDLVFVMGKNEVFAAGV